MAPLKESAMFRSADMSFCQLFLPIDSALECIVELGEAGVVQFRDLNAEQNAYQRRFINEIRRCEELERKLRFIENEIVTDGLNIEESAAIAIPCPKPSEINELEVALEKMEDELININKNTKALEDSRKELWQMLHVNSMVKEMFDTGDHRERKTSRLSEILNIDDDSEIHALDGAQFKVVPGVIRRDKLRTFQLMVWRMGKGEVLLRSKDCPADSNLHGKQDDAQSVFVLFFSGEQLAQRVYKVCAAFHARIYHCPEEEQGRRELQEDIEQKLRDLHEVLDLTSDYRIKVISAAARSYYEWKIKVLKLKMVYHTLNMKSVDITQKCLVGECWIPTSELENVKDALARGAMSSGSAVTPVLNEMAHAGMPPTFFTTNKFTKSYQSIVDSYGIADYKELNPAPWSIISFPFIFAVMYGDVGHALIMLIGAVAFVAFENKIIAMKIREETFTIFFDGRYVILLMSLFSLYTGLIYNDVYSKSVNIFGSSWATDANNNSCWQWKGLSGIEDWERTAASENKTFEIMLDPIYCYDKEAGPYLFGVDPVWNLATNKLNFLNSMKMKTSVILGIMQMLFGLFVSLGNHIYNRSRVDVFFIFIPQIMFLSSIFVYLCLQMIVKWIFFPANQSWVFGRFYPGSNCAPSLLIGLINMFMMTPRTDGFGEFNNSTVEHVIGADVNLEDFSNEYNCSIAFWYPGESTVEKILLALAAISIPLMLLVKPFYMRWRHLRGLSVGHVHGAEEGPFSFADVMVYQAIHTIEFALGCISHTASYLRLWALSLAHAQLSEVLWSMLLGMALRTNGWMGSVMQFFLWWIFGTLSFGILIFMEGLSAFLHALRLHWVEFQSKFYSGNGVAFQPFSFEKQIRIVEGLDN